MKECSCFIQDIGDSEHQYCISPGLTNWLIYTLFSFLSSSFLNTESHIDQASLQHTMKTRSSCLHLQTICITDMLNHTWLKSLLLSVCANGVSRAHVHAEANVRYLPTSSSFWFYKDFFYLYECFTYIHVKNMYAWCLRRSDALEL